jgi:hypothetical protein
MEVYGGINPREVKKHAVPYIYDLDMERSIQSRGNSLGIATGYELDDRGSRVRFPARAGIFFFSTASRTAQGPTQSPIQWVPGALSLG